MEPSIVNPTLFPQGKNTYVPSSTNVINVPQSKNVTTIIIVIFTLVLISIIGFYLYNQYKKKKTTEDKESEMSFVKPGFSANTE